MTKLIEKDDPRYFSQTSNEPYDRHYYQIVCRTKSFVVESWEEVQEYWWNNCHSPSFEGTVVKVIDKPKKKSKGFNSEVNEKVTDESILMEKMGYSIRLVDGHIDNLKITFNSDWKFAEFFVKGFIKDDL